MKWASGRDFGRPEEKDQVGEQDDQDKPQCASGEILSVFGDKNRDGEQNE